MTSKYPIQKTCVSISNTNVLRSPPLHLHGYQGSTEGVTWAGETELKEKRMDAYRQGRINATNYFM